MSEYFGRVYEVTIEIDGGEPLVYDGFVDQPLQMNFQVDQTPQAHLTYAEITLYGLSRASRKAIYERHKQVTLIAGWTTLYGTIFQGQIQNVEIGREGADPLVRMYCRSATNEYEESSVNQPFEAGTSFEKVLRHVAQSFGRPVDFIGDFSDLPAFIKGKTARGDSKDEMNRLMRGVQGAFEWFFDSNGRLQVVRTGAQRDDAETYRYTPTNGLIGSPEVRLDGTDIDVLLNARIRPRDLFSVESETRSLTFNAVYYKPFEYPRTTGEGLNQVLGLRHEGDYYGDTWQSSLEGRRVQG